MSTPRAVKTLVRRTRPARVKLTPWRFKETYMNRALAAQTHPTTYVEIGVRDGTSLRAVHADRKIGVDPMLHERLTTLRPGEMFHQMTSDEWFEQVAPTELGLGSVDVALVDGLHEFRQTLRDVLNMEPYMAPGGFIFIDDVNPRSEAAQADVPSDTAWNGDVWKAMVFLVEERQDLKAWTLDADEGIGVVRGFGATVPAPPDDQVGIYKKLPYPWLNKNRRDALRLVPRSRFDAILQV